MRIPWDFQGRWHSLLPDAALAYRAREQTIQAWLEWDEGTMNRRDLEAKMQAYAQCIRARQWMKEGPVLPILVIVVPKKGQELRMVQVVREMLGGTTLVVRSTTATRLEEHGVLGEIWLPTLRRLQHLLGEQYNTRQAWLDRSQ